MSDSTEDSLSEESNDETLDSESAVSYSSIADSVWGINKYDTVADPRVVVRQYLEAHLGEHARTTEIRIFNVTVRLARKMRMIMRPVEGGFHRYSDSFRRFYTETAYEVITTLQHFDFRHEHLRRIMHEIDRDIVGWDCYLYTPFHFQEKMYLEELVNPIPIEEGIHVCIKCKRAEREFTKTVSFDIQTRSADEPMTTFITCTVCNARWRIG